MVNIVVCCVVQGWSLYQEPSTIGAVGALQTSLFYEKGLGLSLSKKIHLSSITLGGMIEVRNDTHFNQSALPNHSWRGNLLIGFDSVFVGPDFGKYKSVVAVYGIHQSAHATMGIQEDISNPSYEIYDGTYRQSNLNALVIQLNIKSSVQFQWYGSGLGYVYSKNSPELPGSQKDVSFGVRTGARWEKSVVAHGGLFMCAKFEYIAEGTKKVKGWIADTDGLEEQAYPVISDQYRISSGIGFIYYGFEMVVPSLYSSYSYGSRSGYYDSRERLHLFRLGLIIN
ncbi:MAG: hypothetical protein OCC49_11130 [Fibrobacterales bacterium]